MSPFQMALKDVLKHEGGYVNDPDDMGGETNYGITKRTAAENGYSGPMKDIPMGVVEKIYREKYWNVNKLDDIEAIDIEIAFEMFDAGVNCGPLRAAEWLQTMLNLMNKKETLWDNIPVDGDIGPLTIRTFSKMPFRDYMIGLQILKALRASHYLTLCQRKENQEKFLRGWFKRLI